MSCVKNISRAFFLTIVIVGFMSMFHQNFKSHNVNKYEQSPKETMVKKTKKVGDFSKIDNSFEVQKTGGMLGYNVVLAQHKPSGQKMVVVDTGKNKVITQDDVKSENAEERILKKISKIKYQSVSLDEFHVT